MEGNRRLHLGDITNLYNTGLDSPTDTSNVRNSIHRELGSLLAMQDPNLSLRQLTEQRDWLGYMKWRAGQ